MKVINVLDNPYFISTQYLMFYAHEIKDLMHDVPAKDKQFIRPFYGVNQVVPVTPSASNANYIESNDLPTYPTDSAFSVELLFSQYTPPSDNDMAHIFSYGYISGGVFRGIYVYGLANNRFKIEVTNGSESVEYEGIIYDDELPDVFRLAFSFQPDNIFIYYNDLSYNTKVTSIDTTSGITLPLDNGNPTLLIGGLGTNTESSRNISPFTDSNNVHATFTLNELRIWQSARDVTELNNNFLTINDNSDLFLHYAINEGRGNTLNNTGNVINDGEEITDYNATIQNSTTDNIQWDTGTPFLIVTIAGNNQIVTWMSGTPYPVNTIVQYNNVLYFNNVEKTELDTDDPSVDDDWLPISGVAANDASIRNLISDWAENGNTDPIPANKLINASGSAISTWISGVAYSKSTIVEYNNILYYTITAKTTSDTTSPDVDSDWIALGTANITNAITSWIPATEYGIQRIVEYKSVLYFNAVAKTTSDTTTPDVDNDWIAINNVGISDIFEALDPINLSVTSNLIGITSHNGIIYLIDFNSRTLYSVNLTNGVLTAIGGTGALGDERGESLTSHNGNLYTINNTSNNLSTIDVTSGTISIVGSLPSLTYTALASDGTNLYTIDNNSKSLYIIDISNNTTTLVGTAGSLGNKSWTGLTYDTTENRLLALNNTDKRVESINVIDGTTSILDGANIIVSTSIDGLTYYNNTIYILSGINGRLYPVRKTRQISISDAINNSVLDWAKKGNTDPIPTSKLTNVFKW